MHPIVYSVLNNNGCLSRDTSYIEVFNLNDLTEESPSVVIYPNPASSGFTIDISEPAHYIMFTQDGRVVKEGSCEINALVNTEKLSVGNYFLKIVSSTKVLTKKIIVRR